MHTSASPGRPLRSRMLTLLALLIATVPTVVGCSESRSSPPREERRREPVALDVDARAGEMVFRSRCASCHTVGGGRSVGPDLENVLHRRDRDWLVRWLQDPVGMGQRDEVGRELVGKYDGVVMTDPGLNDRQIRQVLSYLAVLGH
jgi:mono/diheme cytochrome c family protein